MLNFINGHTEEVNLSPSITFTTSAAGSNINFFSGFSSISATPLSDYTVYINDIETSQQYNSLTFAEGDVIKIKAKDGVDVYPVIYASDKNYIKSIDAPFPRMVDASGDATNFNMCFSNCSDITSIPKDLFRYNTAATSFSYCFRYCTGFTSIPADLFKYNTAVTSFSHCFRGCSKLTSIPADLFKYNTKVTNFLYCFGYCESVTSALPTLWISHSSASGSYCFLYCTNASNYQDAVNAGWAE